MCTQPLPPDVAMVLCVCLMASGASAAIRRLPRLRVIWAGSSLLTSARMVISSAPRVIRLVRPFPQLVGRRSHMPSPISTSSSTMFDILAEVASLTPFPESAAVLDWLPSSLATRKIASLWLVVRAVEDAKSARRMMISRALALPSTFSRNWLRVKRSPPFLFMAEIACLERRRAMSFCSRCQTHRQQSRLLRSFPTPMKELRSSHQSMFHLHPKSAWNQTSCAWERRIALRVS